MPCKGGVERRENKEMSDLFFRNTAHVLVGQVGFLWIVEVCDFDSEGIVGAAKKTGLSPARLQNGLGDGDRCGYPPAALRFQRGGGD